MNRCTKCNEPLAEIWGRYPNVVMQHKDCPQPRQCEHGKSFYWKFSTDTTGRLDKWCAWCNRFTGEFVFTKSQPSDIENLKGAVKDIAKWCNSKKAKGVWTVDVLIGIGEALKKRGF